MDLRHNVINEQIFFEFFLQDEDLVLGFDAVVTIKPPNFEILRKDTGVEIHHNCIILPKCFYLSFEGSQVFLHFQYLKIFLLTFIFLLFLLDQIEQSNGRILFLINTANNLTMMDVLIPWDLRKGGTDLFIFNLYLSTLDGIVMYHKIPC